MKTYFRIILTFVIILLTLITTALSCEKKDGVPDQFITNEGNVTNVTNKTNVTNVVDEINETNNTNNTNVAKNTSILNKGEIVSESVEGGRPIARIPVAEGLENFVITVDDTYAKLEGGAIYINVTKLANDLGPAISDANGAIRGVGKLARLVDDSEPGGVNVPGIFGIEIRDSVGGILLVQPDTVTRDTLEYKTEASVNGYPPALNGAPVVTDTYRTYTPAATITTIINHVIGGWFGGWFGDIVNSIFQEVVTTTDDSTIAGPFVWNTFGDFSHTDPNEAQGVFYCRAYLIDLGGFNQDGPLTGGQSMGCRFASINNAVNPTAEVDEAWLESTETTKTLKLKLFGIDTGMRDVVDIGAGISSGADFVKPIPNETMQQIIESANNYYESELTIKLVKEEDF